mmetsp:Transcript_19694/g.36256  ORF Transcript_19694/g.36256 Transcript_19694/m.36256 type:complete len:201 (-) Transcript_19694:11768-12370(-)
MKEGLTLGSSGSLELEFPSLILAEAGPLSSFSSVSKFVMIFARTARRFIPGSSKSFTSIAFVGLGGLRFDGDIHPVLGCKIGGGNSTSSVSLEDSEGLLSDLRSMLTISAPLKFLCTFSTWPVNLCLTVAKWTSSLSTTTESRFRSSCFRGARLGMILPLSSTSLAPSKVLRSFTSAPVSLCMTTITSGSLGSPYALANW